MKATTKVKAHNVRATLRNRKRCYNNHPLTPENVDHYGKDGYRKSERTQPGQITWLGCRRCRKEARLRWRIKQARKLTAARNAERKVAKAALANARPGKAATPRKAAPKVARKAATPRKVARKAAPKVARKAAREPVAMFSVADVGKGVVKAKGKVA